MGEHPQVDLHTGSPLVAGVAHAYDSDSLAGSTAQERAQVSPGAWRGPHSSSPEGSSAICMSEHAAHQHLVCAHSPLSFNCKQAPLYRGFTDTSAEGGIHIPFRLVDK